MADAVTLRTLFDDGGSVCIMGTNVSDGTGETDAIKLDSSAMVNSNATSTRYALEAIAWCNVGMGFKLEFDATTDVVMFDTGNTSSAGFLDFTSAPAGNPATRGIPDSLASGATGDFLLTTAGHTSGDTYWFMMWARKIVA